MFFFFPFLPFLPLTWLHIELRRQVPHTLHDERMWVTSTDFFLLRLKKKRTFSEWSTQKQLSIMPLCMMKECGLACADCWTCLPICATVWRSSARRSLSCLVVPCPLGLVGRLPPHDQRTPSRSGCVNGGRVAEGGHHGVLEGSGACRTTCA